MIHARWKYLLSLSLLLSQFFHVGASQAAYDQSLVASNKLAELSLEELMNIKIVTVGKKPQSLFSVPAAVHVITQEDIRRSGVRSIPEALRMVPGIAVSQINGYIHSVSIRGFLDQFANKLLVLIDGRSIYSNATNGVFWQLQDIVLEDVDRIEVIRGPGGSLWGSNAVNGVINIITKNAKNTHGALFVAGGGSEERGFFTGRYGFNIGEKAHIRFFVKMSERDENQNLNDSSRKFHAGTRADLYPTEKDHLYVKGDYTQFNGNRTATLPDFINNTFNKTEFNENGRTANWMLNWKHDFSKNSDLTSQVYYDYYRSFSTTGYSEDVSAHTIDFDIQQRLNLPSARQEINIGGGYRLSFLDTSPGTLRRYTPAEVTNHLFSGFIQDEITLVKNHLKLTLGSKFEHNSYTEFEYQPSARLGWEINPKHFLWGSFSRVVRVPSMYDHNFSYDYRLIPPSKAGNPPLWILLGGNNNLSAEKLYSAEFGYRTQPHANVSLDIASFFNFYRDIIQFTAQGKGAPTLSANPFPHLTLDLPTENDIYGNTYGVEALATWKPLPWWKMTGNYSYIKFDLKTKNGNGTPQSISGRSPHHQMGFWSQMDFPHNFELDFGLRYISKLSRINIPAYITGNARLAWKPHKNLELAVVGSNLFGKTHLEFQTIDIGDRLNVPIERSVYGQIVWNWK